MCFACSKDKYITFENYVAMNMSSIQNIFKQIQYLRLDFMHLPVSLSMKLTSHSVPLELSSKSAIS